VLTLEQVMILADSMDPRYWLLVLLAVFRRCAGGQLMACGGLTPACLNIDRWAADLQEGSLTAAVSNGLRTWRGRPGRSGR
jgi:hypothetical protein